MNLIDDYFDIYKSKVAEYGRKTCVLYAVGSFYEVYRVANAQETIGNADEIAEVLHFMYSNKNKAKRQLEGSSRAYPDFCGFTTSCLPKYLPILLENDYTVVVVDQLEDSSTKRGKLVRRGITAVHSPCLQPPDLESAGTSNNLVGLFLEASTSKAGTGNGPGESIGTGTLLYSVVCVNNSTNVIEICESGVPFTTNRMETCFDEINRILLKYNPKHIVTKYHDTFEPYKQRFLQSVQQYSIKIDPVDPVRLKQYTSVRYQNEYFSKVYSHITSGLLESVEALGLERLPLSIINFMFLLDFIAKHDTRYVSNLTKPIVIDESEHLTLELNTLSQLNIVPTRHSVQHKYGSLFNVIDFTQTAIGRRQLRRLLTKPYRDPDTIAEKYTIVEILNTLTDNETSSLDTCLQKQFDIERLHRKMGLQSLHPCEFEKLHTSYMSILQAVTSLSDRPDTLLSLSKYLPDRSTLELFHEYITDYTSTFDFVRMATITLNVSRECCVNYFKSGIVEALDSIENTITKLESEIEALRVSYDTLINTSQTEGSGSFIKLGFTDQEGYHFTCTKARYQALLKRLSKQEVDEITIRQTSNTCKIFTSRLTRLSNELVNNRELLHKRVKMHYLQRLSTYYNRYYHVFENIQRFIETVDIARSTARCARRYRYCKPELFLHSESESECGSGNSFVEAEQLRHAIIERMDVEYVPNDVQLNRETTGILLYGLNSSGKSSLLRAVGISVVLAQIGYYVPCRSFRFSPFHRLISQVDMTDDLFTGKSSFTSEMFSLKRILQCAGKNTLVLADELCKTTEYYSAQGIVTSTIVRLIQTQTPFFFTTHLHEIPKIPIVLDEPRIRVCHLSITVKENRVIYERLLQSGSGSELYGLEIAKNILDDMSFIDTAFEVRNVITNNPTSVMSTKRSVYNRDKTVDLCEVCGSKERLEIHHINFQKNCDSLGFVNDKAFHKNELYNLVCLCKNCHIQIDKNLFVYGYKTSTSGTFLDFQWQSMD